MSHVMCHLNMEKGTQTYQIGQSFELLPRQKGILTTQKVYIYRKAFIKHCAATPLSCKHGQKGN